MSKHAEALNLAIDVWKRPENYRGPAAMSALAHTGLFTHIEIAAITDRTPGWVFSWAKRNNVTLPPYKFGQNFDPKALDSLALMELQWRYSRRVVPGVFDLVHPACSRTVISRLTGVPIDALPRAV